MTDQIIAHLKILDLLHKANESGIRYPKIRMNTEVELDLQLSLAGPNAKFPGCVNLTNGIGYNQPGNHWYGRINRDGKIAYPRFTTEDEKETIEYELLQFGKNPAGYAKLYGKETGGCMFCGKTLTDPQSIAVGYGPVCASRYGLPHGNLEADIASELSQMEFKMSDIKPPKINEDEIKIANWWNSVNDNEIWSGAVIYLDWHELTIPWQNHLKNLYAGIIEFEMDSIQEKQMTIESMDDIYNISDLIGMDEIVFPFIVKLRKK